jgi:hypothetical protein
MLVFFMAIWNILWPFGIIYGRLVQFVDICYIFPVLVCLEQEKSGNPDYGVQQLEFLLPQVSVASTPHART